MHHRKIQVVVIDGKNRLLLLRTNRDRGNFWQNITGSVEDGEDFKGAAIRELHEEIGISITEGRLIDLKIEFEFKNREGALVKERAFLYMGSEDLMVQLSAEHDLFKFVPIADVKDDAYKFESNYTAFLESLQYV